MVAASEIDSIVVDPETEDLASTFGAEADLEAAAAIEDEAEPDPAIARVPTKPVRGPVAGRIELDLEDPDAAASFLELVARVIRSKGRIVLIVE